GMGEYDTTWPAVRAHAGAGLAAERAGGTPTSGTGAFARVEVWRGKPADFENKEARVKAIRVITVAVLVLMVAGLVLGAGCGTKGDKGDTGATGT
ncbi:MAG: hypothetical protein NTU41_06705, partial [Chloroflexi bacterium]|nr:hypothetical protein [Chloroflexota bacterium]